MAASLNTFIDIFTNKFPAGEEMLELKEIVIPKIQRDYAQGRLDPNITRIRVRFLKALHEAILADPITLDFVYGDIDEEGVMYPLDGQQRLTTLFLLHWYAAKKENIDTREYEFLKRFTYDTRYSARDFCSLLIDFNPTFTGKISEEIIDEGWFPLDWKKDATIDSMLTMLDSILEEFVETEDIWEKLKSKAISFYFLPIKEMGLTDELYIKMNSRGKPLTTFEHFKAEFERELSKIDLELAKRIIFKIDTDWTDMLWKHRSKEGLVDEEFLRYFKFIFDIISYKNNGTSQGRNYDEFNLLSEFFSGEKKEVLSNIIIFEEYFDCWTKELADKDSQTFFQEFISHGHEIDKIKIENRYNIDIFNDCLKKYGETTGRGNRVFPLNRIVVLYAFITYLLEKDKISKIDFTRRIRIVNNLVANSEDEISDSIYRSSGNRMPAILKQVEYIVINGEIDKSIENNFNQHQLKEEKNKIDWVKKYPDKKEDLFELEDHNLLFGQISILGLENSNLFKRFESLFYCKLDKIDCALLTIGNYSQQDNRWRYQLGSRRNLQAWRNLFHKSSSKGFENTKSILVDLLSKNEVFSNDFLDSLIDKFIKKSEEKNTFDWRYYYIKYDIFRPGSHGKYNWEDFLSRPYEFLVMQTPLAISIYSYIPFLKEIDKDNLSIDDYGKSIIIEDKYITSENDRYLIKDLESKAEIESIIIKQDENGIDIEDRIKKFKEIYNNIN